MAEPKKPESGWRWWLSGTPGFVLGCLLIFGSTAIVFTALDPSGLGQFLKDWQTLIGGAFAVFAAVAAVRAVQEQIRQAEIHNRERLERERAADRVVLPLVLRDLVDYADRCLELIARRLRSPTARIVAFPPLPQGFADAIKNAVRSGEGTEIEELSSLLRWAQIQNSRISRDLGSTVRYTMYHFAVDAAELSYRAESLIAFARGDEPLQGDRSIGPTTLVNRLTVARVWDLEPDEFKLLLARRFSPPLSLRRHQRPFPRGVPVAPTPTEAPEA